MKKLKEEKLHFTLLDPDKDNELKPADLAMIADMAGTDAILVGGSSPITKTKLDQTIRQIKKRTELPVILFPSSVGYLSSLADAVFYMSLLNSNDPRYIIREPAKGAPIIKKMGIEPISMGYLVIEPGMTVGKVGKAELIKRDDVKSAVEYAIHAQYLGIKFFYLETGSGSPEPVPAKMIKAVKKEIDIPVIVGGGISTPKIAREEIKAGADIIVTGTSLEKGEIKQVQEIISAIKKTT